MAAPLPGRNQPQIQYPWAQNAGAGGYGGKQRPQTTQGGGYGDDPYRRRRPMLGYDPLIGTRPEEPSIGGQEYQTPKDQSLEYMQNILGQMMGGGKRWSTHRDQPESKPSLPGQPGPGGGSGTGVNMQDWMIPSEAMPGRNPYAGIGGFQNWGTEHQAGSEQIPQLRKWRRSHPGMVPGKGGFPSRERVGQISEAMDRFRGFPMMQPRGMGRGADVETYDDILKRMLRERMYGGGE